MRSNCSGVQLTEESERLTFLTFGKTGPYSRLILTLSQQLRHPGEAFEYLEQSRSRTFLDLLGFNQRFFAEGEFSTVLNFSEIIELM